MLNYRKAQANLEEVIERRDTLITGVKTYQQYLEELNEWQEEIKLQAELDAIKVDEVNNPDGLQVTTILRVANLVGKYYKAKISVLFSNTTKDKVFQIEQISSTCYFKDQAVMSADYTYPTRKSLECVWVRPGETVEKDFDAKTYKLPELAKEMRDYITAYCGKSLITSCPKVNIDDKVENANILFTWKSESLIDHKIDEKFNTAQYRAKPGVLRYCGEGGLK